MATRWGIRHAIISGGASGIGLALAQAQDGTIVRLNIPFFKAVEGISLAEAQQLNLHDYIETVPGNA